MAAGLAIARPKGLSQQGDPIAALPKEELTVDVVGGNIVVNKNDTRTPLTSDGQSSNPTLSPDKSKVAYITKSKETIAGLKADPNYKKSSTNLVIIDLDGSNLIMVTTHSNNIDRGLPHWLDDERIVYAEGESSAKIFNLRTRSSQTVLGTPTPKPVCTDACGYESHFYYSPDYKYLVRLIGGYHMLTPISILDLTTLKNIEIKTPYFIDFGTVKLNFDGRKIVFQGRKISSGAANSLVTIDLDKGLVTP